MQRKIFELKMEEIIEECCILYKINLGYLNKPCVIIILPFVSYRREIWSLTLNDFRVYENVIFRVMFLSKW